MVRFVCLEIFAAGVLEGECSLSLRKFSLFQRRMGSFVSAAIVGSPMRAMYHGNVPILSPIINGIGPYNSLNYSTFEYARKASLNWGQVEALLGGEGSEHFFDRRGIVRYPCVITFLRRS